MLKENDISPIVKSRPLRWVILPSSLSTVPLLGLNHQWHVFLVLPGGTKFPATVEAQIAAKWTVAAGVPSRLLENFDKKNEELLNPASVKPAEKSNQRKASSSQTLELSLELEAWISDLPAKARTHPISMFNLLAFNPDKKADYLKYGQAFSKTIGSRHGLLKCPTFPFSTDLI